MLAIRKISFYSCDHIPLTSSKQFQRKWWPQIPRPCETVTLVYSQAEGRLTWSEWIESASMDRLCYLAELFYFNSFIKFFRFFQSQQLFPMRLFSCLGQPLPLPAWDRSDRPLNRLFTSDFLIIIIKNNLIDAGYPRKPSHSQPHHSRNPRRNIIFLGSNGGHCSNLRKQRRKSWDYYSRRHDNALSSIEKQQFSSRLLAYGLLPKVLEKL